MQHQLKNKDALANDLLSALIRAIEQHEAYKQDVSDAIEHYLDQWRHSTPSREMFLCQFGEYIIAKPDPLVEVISSALREGSPFDEDGSHDYTAEAKVIAAAIEARGGRIVWEGE